MLQTEKIHYQKGLLPLFWNCFITETTPQTAELNKD